MRLSLLLFLLFTLSFSSLQAQEELEVNYVEISFQDYAEELELTIDQLEVLATLRNDFFADAYAITVDTSRSKNMAEATRLLVDDYNMQMQAVLSDQQSEKLKNSWLADEINEIQTHFRQEGLGIDVSDEQAYEMLQLYYHGDVSTDFDEGVQAILTDEQKVKYQQFLDRGIEPDKTYQEKRRQSMQEGIAVFQILNDEYITKLREIRTRVETYLSAGDSRSIDALRRLRLQQSDHLTQMMEEEMVIEGDSPEDLVPIAVRTLSYTFQHFPRDYTEMFPAPDMPVIDWDSSAVLSLVNRHRETLEPFELFIYEVAEDTKQALTQFVETLDSREAPGLDLIDEIGGMVYLSTDSLSAGFIETFLLMQPLELEEDDADARNNPFGLTAYPSPARTTQTIEFYLPAEGQVILEVVDQNGKILNTLQRGRLPQGEHRFDTDVSRLPDGIHYYRLTHPSGVGSFPIIVER